MDDPQNVRKLIRGFWVCCALLLVPDLLEFLGLVHFKHPHQGFEVGGYAWERFVGFFAIYGFVACVVLVLIAKQIRKVVMRAEDYYDE